MQVEEGLQDVQHAGHLGEDERLVPACLQPMQQPCQLLHQGVQVSRLPPGSAEGKLIHQDIQPTSKQTNAHEMDAQHRNKTSTGLEMMPRACQSCNAQQPACTRSFQWWAGLPAAQELRILVLCKKQLTTQEQVHTGLRISLKSRAAHARSNAPMQVICMSAA